MVYECDQCGKPLAPAVMSCPTCGEKFDEAVPADAVVPANAVVPADAVVLEPIFGPTSLGSKQNDPTLHAPVYAQGPIRKSVNPYVIFAGIATVGIIAAAIGINSSQGSSSPIPRPETVTVEKIAVQIPHRRSNVPVLLVSAPKAAAPELSQDQRNSGFLDLNYALAYDRFGRAIMRRDHDVKEVAESSRDSASSFYVTVRRDRLSASRAASRAQRYLNQFVAMRRNYFSPEEAQKAEITVRASGDSIMASANSEGSKPDCIFYDTCDQQTAAEAASPPSLDEAIARLQSKCGPDASRDNLLAVANKAHDLMAQRGVEEDPASIASHVADTIPAGYEPGKRVTEFFGAYIVLRVGDRN